jgi:hypothetical protein
MKHLSERSLQTVGDSREAQSFRWALHTELGEAKEGHPSPEMECMQLGFSMMCAAVNGPGAGLSELSLPFLPRCFENAMGSFHLGEKTLSLLTAAQ